MPIPSVGDVHIPPFEPLPPFVAADITSGEPPLADGDPVGGEASAEHAVGVALERIEQLDHELRAFIHVAADRARRRAQELDAYRQRHGPVGPLHGVTLAVKDCIDVAGLPTTCGTRDGDRRPVPTRTAACVRDLEAAGAIVVGKTNLHEWAFGATSDNPWYGRVRNPLDPERGPGGSSGGSAVAVATGMARIALGTDTGGSVRIPAAYTGILGHKPTLGRGDLSGVEPLSWTLDTVGPLARAVNDLTLAHQVLRRAGPRFGHDLGHRGDPPARIGVLTGPPFDGAHLDPAVRSAFDATLLRVEESGAEVRPLHLPELAHVRDAFFPIVLAEASVVHGGARRAERDRYGDDIRAALEEGDEVTAGDYLSALRWRHSLAAAFSDAFERVDLLLTPTSAVPPLPHDAGPVSWPDGSVEPAIEAAARMCLPASLAGLPAASVPAPDPGELPVGVQIIGRVGADDQVLAAAGWFTGLAAADQ